MGEAINLMPATGEEWHGLCSQFDDHNYEQTQSYGRLAARRRHARLELVACMRDGDAIGLAGVRTRAMPLLGGGIAYVSGGPLVCRHGLDPDAVAERFRECVEALRTEYVCRRGLTLRILPPLRSASWSRVQAAILCECGFTASTRGRGYRTLLVDLHLPLAQLRGRLRQKWRNCLNSAERQGLSIHSGTDEALLDSFGVIFDETLRRKGFRVSQDVGFFAGVQRGLRSDEKLRVSIARLDGEAIAGHVSSTLGDTAVYLLGASSARGLKSKASYLLQWDALEHACDSGCRVYDLGGIDPEGNPGVHHFKSGLCGVDCRAAGPVEARAESIGASIALHAEAFRRRAA